MQPPHATIHLLRSADPDALSTPPPGADRHTAQLAHQAHRSLQIALHAAADPVLQQLELLSVQPRGRSAAQLLVVVRPPADLQFTEKDIRSRLERASGYFRSELATDINRRAVPSLSFRIVPPAPPTAPSSPLPPPPASPPASPPSAPQA